MAQEGAQTHHYVPKFILRKFLANKKKERVNVFQKSTGRQFQTSIANVMAERRFYEFQLDENYYASFEDSACRVEDAVLPAYEALVERQHLEGTPDEKIMLGLFVAFQMLRTRGYKDKMEGIFRQIEDHIKKMDVSKELLNRMDVASSVDATQHHLESLRRNIHSFMEIIAEKDFVLLEAPENRRFYLSDNPVTLHNDEGRGSLVGNIGLSVKGIQIYVPLTSRFMLAAWCPSILGLYKRTYQEQRKIPSQLRAAQTLSPTMLSQEKSAEFEVQIAAINGNLAQTEKILTAAESGMPLLVTDENMDFYNSIQVASAREFIVCERADFDLAKRFVKEHGANGGGFELRVG